VFDADEFLKKHGHLAHSSDTIPEMLRLVDRAARLECAGIVERECSLAARSVSAARAEVYLDQCEAWMLDAALSESNRLEGLLSAIRATLGQEETDDGS